MTESTSALVSRLKQYADGFESGPEKDRWVMLAGIRAVTTELAKALPPVSFGPIGPVSSEWLLRAIPLQAGEGAKEHTNSGAEQMYSASGSSHSGNPDCSVGARRRGGR